MTPIEVELLASYRARMAAAIRLNERLLLFLLAFVLALLAITIVIAWFHISFYLPIPWLANRDQRAIVVIIIGFLAAVVLIHFLKRIANEAWRVIQQCRIENEVEMAEFIAYMHSPQLKTFSQAARNDEFRAFISDRVRIMGIAEKHREAIRELRWKS